MLVKVSLMLKEVRLWWMNDYVMLGIDWYAPREAATCSRKVRRKKQVKVKESHLRGLGYGLIELCCLCAYVWSSIYMFTLANCISYVTWKHAHDTIVTLSQASTSIYINACIV